jgi:putative endonuclease
MRPCWVYILASRSGVLYVGMTNDLKRRIWQHKQKEFPGFTATYNVDRLVFYKEFPAPAQAIINEKRVKGWTRAKKIALIETNNPKWVDLSDGWFAPLPPPSSGSD